MKWPSGTQGFWFTGTDSGSLWDAVSSAQASEPGRKFVIVLDEDRTLHPPRSVAFYEDLLGGGIYSDLVDLGHAFLLTIWPSTYDCLLKQKLLAEYELRRLPSGGDALDGGELASVLTPAQKARIKEIACLGGVLNLWFVEKVCLRALADGTLFDDDLAPGKSISERAYARLIAPRPPADEIVLRVLAEMRERAVFVPDGLLRAGAAAAGTPLDQRQLQSSLAALVDDQIVEEGAIDALLKQRAWRFSHDRWLQTVEEYHQAHGPRQTALCQLDSAVTKLAEAHAPADTDEWAQAFLARMAILGTATADPRSALDPLLTAAKHIASTDSQRDEICALIVSLAAITWREARMLPPDACGTAFHAMSELAALVAEIARPQWLLADLRNRPCYVLGMGNAIRAAARRSGADTTVGGLAEAFQSQVVGLHEIGLKATEAPWPSVFRDFLEYWPRIRYAQLLAWACKWEDAAAAAMQATSEAAGNDETFALGRFSFAAAVSLQAGDKVAAAGVYSHLARQLHQRRTAGADALSTVMRRRARRLQEWEGTPTWQEFLEHTSREDLRRVRPGDTVIIAGCDDLGLALLVSDAIHARGTRSVVCNPLGIRSPEDLKSASGVVLLGGTGVADLRELLLGLIGSRRLGLAHVKQKTPPEYSQVEFRLADHPAVWIAGYYPWDLLNAVARWLHGEGLDRFVTATQHAGDWGDPS